MGLFEKNMQCVLTKEGVRSRVGVFFLVSSCALGGEREPPGEIHVRQGWTVQLPGSLRWSFEVGLYSVAYRDGKFHYEISKIESAAGPTILDTPIFVKYTY